VRRAPATSSRRSRVPLAAGIALLALVALLAAGTAEMATSAAAATASAVSLIDDDGGAALFSAPALRPGQVQAGCVGVSSSGSVDAETEVSLSAAVLSAGLAPFLQVWVERGNVPAGGSCGDFTGVVIWSGTLDRFPATGTAGIPTGWHPALSKHSVYRFTVSVADDPRAQALGTSATFQWSFTEAAAPAPLPVPTTDVPPPTRAPVSDVPDSGAPTTTDPVPADTTVPPTIDPPTSTPVPTAGGRPRDIVEAPPISSGPAAVVKAALDAAGKAVQQVGRTAVAVAHNGQYPLALVGVVAAFLFLQGQLDRRDPKLALARVREELSEYREFPEPPPTETT